MLENGFYDVPAGKMAVVVTHLEMLAKPAICSANLPDGVTFRQVRPDLGWYRDIFARVGRDWLWYGRRALDDDTLGALLGNPSIQFFTLSENGKDHALLELDFRQKGECELAYFGMTSQMIGRGQGRYLMNQAIERAWAQPIDRFHVHTCTHDSPQALGFYVSSGFTPYRRQVEVDDDPRLSGLLDQDAAPQIPLIKR